MKTITRVPKSLLLGVIAVSMILLSPVAVRAEDEPTPAKPSGTEDKTADDQKQPGDAEWKLAQKAMIPPQPPAEWHENKPSEEDIAKFYTPVLIKGADAAKDFYTRFPSHPKAAQAHKDELRLLNLAVNRFEDATQKERLETLEKERLKDPNITEDEKVQIRLAVINKLMQDYPKTHDEMEKVARDLMKEFPKRAEPYQVLMMLATQGDPEKGIAIAREISAGEAPDQVKKSAAEFLKNAEALGKPMDIKFAAVDGREVDLAKLKDKVVLIDFWATWCGPCVGELPHVKEAYSKLHDKGFEIVGISLDQDKEKLESFVAKEGMTWPQYFDGKGWENSISTSHGIHSIPAMWLVDKKGVLRDMNARGDLEGKVEKLLAE